MKTSRHKTVAADQDNKPEEEAKLTGHQHPQLHGVIQEHHSSLMAEASTI